MANIQLRKILKKIKGEIKFPINEDFSEKEFDISGVKEIFVDVKNNDNFLMLDSLFYSKNLDVNFDYLKLVERLTLTTIKLFIYASDFEISKVNSFLQENEFIVIYSPLKSQEIYSILYEYISFKNAPTKRLHGSLVSVYGEGVLIIGKSGIGKSETVLDLLSKGHMFIGDDAIDVIAFRDRIIGRSAKIIEGLLEIRGIGIINIRKTYGIKAILSSINISLIINLVNLGEETESIDRLGTILKTIDILGVKVPTMKIPVKEGNPNSTLIEFATTELKHKQYENYSAVNELSKKMKDIN